MKKIICIVLAAALLPLVFASCGAKNTESSTLETFEIQPIREDLAGEGWKYAASTGTLSIEGDGAMNAGRPWYDVSMSAQTAEIASGVTSVCDSAFESFRVLKKVIIPGSVTSIGSRSFYMCVALEEITLPSSVASIGQGAFSNCLAVKTMTVPSGVAVIEPNTFYNCQALESITIPASVTTVGENAFYYCAGLKNITYGGTLEQWRSIVIEDGNEYLRTATVTDINGNVG